MSNEFVLRPVEGGGQTALRLRFAGGELAVEGEAPRALRVLRREPGGLVVALWGERVVSGMVSADGETLTISSGGRTERLRMRAAAIDAMEQAAGPAGGANGPLTVSSPIPGLIKSVPVKRGDRVAEGQTVVVLEAMKMENEISAPHAGEVLSVEVEAGQTVAAGVALVKIAP